MSQAAPHILKVGSSSNVKDVAVSIAKCIPEYGTVHVRAVGAGAVNQAAKAVAIARQMTAGSGLDLWTRVGFATVPGETGDISALVFICEAR